MKKFSAAKGARASLIRLTVSIIIIGMLVLVILSPLALRALSNLPGMNWARLSNIGQTYGGVSALLTALALGGVVLSLFYQMRDVNSAREQARRTFHNELLKMELGDPLYMEALGAPWGMSIPADFDSLRKFNFVHMWVAFWSSRYELHEMSEDEVRLGASRELFNGSAGRQYWSAIRDVRLRTSTGRTLRFVKILEEEYQKCLAQGSPQGGLITKVPHPPDRSSKPQISLKETGTLIGLLGVGILIGRRMSRRS